ncbi:4Fe-4S dicluster domain-containing protein [Actinoplanes sp. NPDC024001]|uniref:4Fe-4S dicluster domain-containing protein n=1 Tax=Actinoplanes sp. NPDC024001 TaxID=3154598 RepID=UPI0033C229EE
MGHNSLYGPLDPAPEAGYTDAPPRMGFFTDTSVCIGCKACEVACKEWNLVPDDGFDLLGTSYDNTGGLTANSWRHVAFIEQPAVDVLATAAEPQFLGMPGSDLPGRTTDAPRSDFRWLMMSNVCKHCTHAGCLDVCPTGSLFRTEFGTVVVQEDICNGCGYCIPACPYGVIDRREGDGRAWKCTMCYDRIGDGLTPACAQACPTQSIQYGELSELRDRAQQRVDQLGEQGVAGARLYGHDPGDGVGGNGAFFLLLDEPEVYGLPPDPVVPSRDLPAMWKRAGLAGLAMAAAVAVSFLGGRS